MLNNFEGRFLNKSKGSDGLLEYENLRIPFSPDQHKQQNFFKRNNMV